MELDARDISFFQPWKGLPYFPISTHYQKTFGAKVQKIPVTVVDDCPNRRSLKGMKTCIFCDVWGSAAHSESRQLSLSNQIIKYREIKRRVRKSQKFLVYFQAYTNTFAKFNDLKAQFETAASFDDVVGFVVGTRPDCLSAAVLDLWQHYHELRYVAVEIGVQSFVDEHLEFMRRGHSSQQSLRAISRIADKTDVDLGIHLMFGWPGETDDQVIAAARICNDLPISNVKLHNLHVLTNTPLAEMYEAGEFLPIELEHYAYRVKIFLQHLSPRIAVHRLAAVSSRWSELIAPAWTADRMRTFQYLVDYLKTHQAYQGQYT